MSRIFDTVFITFILIECQYLSCSALSRDEGDVIHERSKRSYFLKYAGVGYVAALAIPLSSLSRERVYMAVSFESHYGLLNNDTVVNLLRMPFPGDNLNKRDVNGIPVDSHMKHLTGDRNAYTRKNLYRIMEQQIESYGYNGTACLLRAICETSETPFHEYNGVFGNIFHILFTPSSSKPEEIRSIYNEAEYHGELQQCHRYYNDCNISFLDLISYMISIERRKFA